MFKTRPRGRFGWRGTLTHARIVSPSRISFQFGTILLLPHVGAEVILPPLNAEDTLELFPFDKSYVDRLRDGDPSTEQHFASYFGQLLGVMLRARYLPPERVDDVRQETFRRVLAALRREGGIREPERFGAFVNSICKNVLHENAREWFRNLAVESDHLEIPNKIADLENELISEETKERVRDILAEMRPRDRELLRAMFLEDKDKDEICREFGVDREYLRVLLYRAKVRFRSTFDHRSEKALRHAIRGRNQ